MQNRATEIPQQSGADVNPISFWKERQPNFQLLKRTAEDLVEAPASQAFVERIYGLWIKHTENWRLCDAK